MARIRLMIHGHVQGVGYRVWLAGQARAKKLTGWVRNRADGGVECVLEGQREALDAIVELCREGPLAARVSHIDTLPAESATEVPAHDDAGVAVLPTV
ncbi:acylphosphatase [Ancylobacter sp. 6x-1]|uniref:acylphosphatase n=1 Tax=Ancylobacter crimeensis TaxID=2579147 RepID=A0ABT0DCU6_9HYPH|nr:acylphosphatase [Ancylobacter crimeensis]MCK0197567.1 acylphosphatase [Ancylobacter crimeensis]